MDAHTGASPISAQRIGQCNEPAKPAPATERTSLPPWLGASALRNF